MVEKYMSLEDLDNANEVDVKFDDGKVVFRIRSVEAELLVGLDFEDLDENKKATPEKISKMMNQIDKIIIAGLVAPKVDEVTVKKLKRFRMPLFRAILDISGMGESEQSKYAIFR